MSKYYINGSVANGRYPYTNLEDAASNFYELLVDPNTKIDLVEGDIIVLYNPSTIDGDLYPGYVIDDSGSDIVIDVSVDIVPYFENFDTYGRPVVRLKTDGVGFDVQSDNVGFYYIEFYKSGYSGGGCIYSVGTENITIDKCKFSHAEVYTVGIPIRLVDCKFAIVDGNEIKIPNDGGGSYGIAITNCTKSDIKNNIIDMIEGGHATAIEVTTTSERAYGINVYNNLIYNMRGRINVGIFIYGHFDDCNVYGNAIRYVGENTYGVAFVITQGGNGIDIRNNVLIRDDDTLNTGIFVSDTGVGEFKVINNIIHNNGSVSPTSGFAFDLGIIKGEVDNNAIYQFDEFWAVNWAGGLSNISEFGDHVVLDIDPKILTIIDELTYPSSAYGSYSVSSSSECLGIGTNYENMGIDYDKDYTSLVDTVTYKMGKISVNNETDLQITFLNDVFSESIETINSFYNKGLTSASNFKNQYSWDSVDLNGDYPFTSGNHLYDKDIFYVIKNKSDLSPFNNLSCPANPGYGFSAYPLYETGIFGFPRAEYINTCLGDPCIIQDDYVVEIIWVTSIDTGDIIQNEIDPPCLSGGQ